MDAISTITSTVDRMQGEQYTPNTCLFTLCLLLLVCVCVQMTLVGYWQCWLSLTALLRLLNCRAASNC